MRQNHNSPAAEPSLGTDDSKASPEKLLGFSFVYSQQK